MDGQSNSPQQPDEPTWQFKPGETISPRTADQTAAAPVSDRPPAQPAPVAAELPAPVIPELPTTSLATSPAMSPDAPAAPLTQGAAPAPAEPLPSPQPVDEPVPAPTEWPSESVSWTASEFIAHHKTPGWHLLVVAVSLVAAVIVWFLTKDLVSPIVIVFAGAILSLYGAHKPQQLQYQVDQEGLTIGTRRFLFGDFRAFSVAPEGAFAGIELVPSKRFAPLVTLYYDPTDEDRILNILGAHLPEQEHKTDAVAALMRRIRF